MKIRTGLTLAGIVSAATLIGMLLFRSTLNTPLIAEEKIIPIQATEGELKNGWKQDFEIPALISPRGETYLKPATVTLWVEQDWLCAVRKDFKGDVEWQVALAQPIQGQLPVVMIDEASASFDLKYGEFFIRENLGDLRLQRQRKSQNSPAWPELRFDGPQPTPGGHGAWMLRSVKLTAWNHNQWRWAVGGLSNDKHDVWVRLEHLDILRKNLNSPVCGFSGGITPPRTFYGERFAVDEGTLFRAERTLAEIAETSLARQKLVAEFGDKPAPSIVATEWKNAPDTTTLDAYKGKVVLLDFWGTWCSPCVDKLPKVQKLYEAYKDKGLVVIGVHSKDGADNVTEFLEKRGITFPIAVDTGKTFENYGIEAVPAYFLIDKSGACQLGFLNDIPKTEEIEMLLH